MDNNSIALKKAQNAVDEANIAFVELLDQLSGESYQLLSTKAIQDFLLCSADLVNRLTLISKTLNMLHDNPQAHNITCSYQKLFIKENLQRIRDESKQ